MIAKKIGRFLLKPLVILTAMSLVITAACTPSDIEALEGILQNVDSANGKITIVTKDGKTVTVKIDTETEVAADGTSASVGNLEPGASVKVKVKKEAQVARQIKARQAEVEGTIDKIDGTNVTIKSEKGRQVTVKVTDKTRIEIDDSPGTLASLLVGMAVEAKYDPSNNQAIKIESEEGAAAIAGWGILELRVTDPPPANVKSSIVHLSNIEVHRVSGNASDSDNATGTWIQITTNITSFDLMDVIGVEQILGAANLTAGKFTQIRMDVTKVTGVTTDNVSYTAEVPGDKLKIVRPFNVGGGTKTVLTLDFDGEKSLIQTGQGKFLFKPVVKLLINNKGSEEGNENGEEHGKPDEPGKGKGKSGNDT